MRVSIPVPRDHGLIFSGPSINAIYANEKCNTSRVAVPQPSSGVRHSVFVASNLEDGHGREIKERFRPGDRIWVKETVIVHVNIPQVIGYVAQGCNVSEHWTRQVSAMFMPRWACRLKLEITDVTLKRVQDLTDLEMLSEGVMRIDGAYQFYRDGRTEPDRQTAFRNGWNHLNAKRKGGIYAWDQNPWIWSLKFRRFDQPPRTVLS